MPGKKRNPIVTMDKAHNQVAVDPAVKENVLLYPNKRIKKLTPSQSIVSAVGRRNDKISSNALEVTKSPQKKHNSLSPLTHRLLKERNAVSSSPSLTSGNSKSKTPSNKRKSNVSVDMSESTPSSQVSRQSLPMSISQTRCSSATVSPSVTEVAPDKSSSSSNVMTVRKTSLKGIQSAIGRNSIQNDQSSEMKPVTPQKTSTKRKAATMNTVPKRSNRDTLAKSQKNTPLLRKHKTPVKRVAKKGTTTPKVVANTVTKVSSNPIYQGLAKEVAISLSNLHRQNKTFDIVSNDLSLYICGQKLLSSPDVDFDCLSRPIRVFTDLQQTDNIDVQSKTSKLSHYEWTLCFGFANRDSKNGEWILPVPGVDPRNTWKPSNHHTTSTPVSARSVSQRKKNVEVSQSKKNDDVCHKEENSASLAYGRLEWFYDLRRAPTCSGYAVTVTPATTRSYTPKESHKRDGWKVKNICDACFNVYAKRAAIHADWMHLPKNGLTMDELTDEELLRRCEYVRHYYSELKKRLAKAKAEKEAGSLSTDDDDDDDDDEEEDDDDDDGKD